MMEPSRDGAADACRVVRRPLAPVPVHRQTRMSFRRRDRSRAYD